MIGMTRVRTVVVLLALALVGCSGGSESTADANVAFSHGWARATPSGAKVGAVYARLSNPGVHRVTISGIYTTVARSAQVHETREVDGMMQMRHVDPLALAAGANIDLAPGGMHLMLMGLTEPLTAGMTFDVIFDLADGQQLTLPVVVGAMDQLQAPAL
ncbi:MAG: copper(I)-binding protein [Cyclobacteriaceae bacterium]